MEYDGLIVFCVVMAVAGFACSASAVEGEKLLFGFERSELDTVIKAGKTIDSFKVLDNGDFHFFAPGGGYFHEREITSIRPMRCAQELVSQGQFSCQFREQFFTPESLGAYPKRHVSYPMFRLPRLGSLPLHLGEPQANLRTPELLNTSGWFDLMFPEDWSGYELLRIDMFVHKVDQVDCFRMEIEDDLVEPPVSITYPVPPAGKWITLELDLEKAVTERKLNLKKMRNMWIRMNIKDAEKHALEMQEIRKKLDLIEKKRFTANLDNIRLAKRGTASKYPIIKGERSLYTKKLPRSYATEEYHDVKSTIRKYIWPDMKPIDKAMPAAATVEPRKSQAYSKVPSVIPVQKMILNMCDKKTDKNLRIHDSVRLTSLVAVDDQQILLAFYIMNARNLKNRSKDKSATHTNGYAVGVKTRDGGKTWTSIDGTEERPTVFGGNTSKLPFRMVDIGNDVAGITYFGCSAIVGVHTGYPADRVFFTRTVFTGDKWWKSPKYFVSGDPRHCHDIEWGDIVRLKSGRLWMGWNGKDRRWYETGPLCSYAYYSDDEGVTWNSWREPGLSGSIPNLKGKYLRVVPYGDYIAMFGSDNWTYFDGKKWSPYKRTGVGGLGPWHALSFGKEIYLASEKGPKRWYDGATWKDFELTGRTGSHGKMGNCGDKVLVFVERDKSGKKLLCWRKQAGAEWSGSEVLLEEKTRINRIAHQRYAPAGFMPIAYTCDFDGPKKKPEKFAIYKFSGFYPWDRRAFEPWIKVLKVPAKR